MTRLRLSPEQVEILIDCCEQTLIFLILGKDRDDESLGLATDFTEKDLECLIDTLRQAK